MITLKKGDTLSIVIKRKDDEGQPLTGDEAKLKSQIRTINDKLVSEFLISETEIPGEYLFTIDAETTKNFNEGSLYFDIEYRDNDVVYSSETIRIQVVKDVTRYEN